MLREAGILETYQRRVSNDVDKELFVAEGFCDSIGSLVERHLIDDALRVAFNRRWS